MTEFEDLVKEIKSLPLWQHLTALRGPRLICVLLCDTLWAVEMEKGKFLRQASVTLGGKPTVETLSAALRALSEKGMSQRAVTVFVNSPRLRIVNKKYPAMEEEEMVETIKWEEDRTFHSREPWSVGHTVMRHTHEGWEVHLTGVKTEEITLWEKAAEEEGRYIYEAIPVTAVPLSEDEYFAFYGRRYSGILLFRKKGLIRSRILREEDRGKGALFMKNTLRNFGLRKAPCFFIPLSDCDEEREEEWKEWLEEEITPAEENTSEETDEWDLKEKEDLPESGGEEDPDMSPIGEYEEEPEDSDDDSGEDHSQDFLDEEEETPREYLPPGTVWLWNSDFEEELTPFQEMAFLFRHAEERTLTLPLSERQNPLYNRNNKYLRLSELAFAAAFLFFTFSFGSFLSARHEVNTLEAEALSLKPEKERMIDARMARRQEEELKTLLKKLDASSENWENRLIALGEGEPSGIVLNEIESEDGISRIKGSAASPSALLSFQNFLRASWGGDLRVERQVDSRTKLVKFTVSRTAEKGGSHESSQHSG